MATRTFLKSLRKDERAVTPVISTLIMTAAIIVTLIVAITFANTYMNTHVAQNEFTTMEQFMQTIGLQIDDVAWIPGRTQTTQYASKYGVVGVQYPALNYNFYADGILVANFSVGVILFDMPVSSYSMGNNYSQQIYPLTNSFLQQNASAPICRVFAVEKLPMKDGSFIRIVVAPIIREITSTLNGASHIELFLPLLQNGWSPHQSQSVTITGQNLHFLTANLTSTVTINVSFPNAGGLGLTSDFFNFDSTSKSINVTPGSVVNIFGGEVVVSLGAYA
jgi:hypothetical protein